MTKSADDGLAGLLARVEEQVGTRLPFEAGVLVRMEIRQKDR